MTAPQRALRDTNRVVTLIGVSSDGSQVPIQVEVDPSTGRLLVQSVGSSGTTAAAINVGQAVLGSSSTQLTASSIVSTNGILVQALSTNAASVYIAGSGVLTTTGYELQAGQAVPFTCANANLLYGISTNGTDGVCFNVL